MYKDKSKQREANRASKARFKAKQGIPATEGIPGIPAQGIPDLEAEKQLAPKEKWAVPGWPPNWMSPLVWWAWMREYRPEYCKALRAQAVGLYRERTDLPEGQHNRVAKPGDTDYEGKRLARQIDYFGRVISQVQA